MVPKMWATSQGRKIGHARFMTGTCLPFTLSWRWSENMRLPDSTREKYECASLFAGRGFPSQELASLTSCRRDHGHAHRAAFGKMLGCSTIAFCVCLRYIVYSCVLTVLPAAAWGMPRVEDTRQEHTFVSWINCACK